jgi:type VI secretion system secreted protein Hcp
MPSDIFMKIGDIKGESNDDKHKGEIEVLSWSWGATQTGSMAYGSGGGTGKVNFQDLVFTHHLDKASPVLYQSCAGGDHIKEATLVQRKAGKGQQEFLVIKMNDVLITTVQVSDHASDGGAPVEQVGLQWSKIDVEYKPQKPDGSLDAGIHFKYDAKLNKAG